MEYRKCFVPTCSNNGTNSPNKIFVRIREDLREKWCRQVGVEYFKVYTMDCCEDHFDPKKDLKNYYQHKLLNEEPRLKPTASICYIAPNKSEDSTELTHKPIKRKSKDTLMPSISSYSTIAVKSVAQVDSDTNAEDVPGMWTGITNQDFSGGNEIKLFCPNCNTEVSHTAEGIREDQTKVLVAKVYHYFEQEYEELKKIYGDLDLTPLSKFRQRTALATGVSEATLLQILKEEEDRNAEKRREPTQKQTDSSSGEGSSDDNGEEIEQPSFVEEVETLVVKMEPPEYTTEEPEIFIPTEVKLEPGDGEISKEDPISVDVKPELRDDALDTQLTPSEYSAPVASSSVPLAETLTESGLPGEGEIKTEEIEIQEEENELSIKEEQLDSDFLDDYKHAVNEDTPDTMYADTEYTMDTADPVSVKDETEYEEIEYLEDEDFGGTNEAAVDTDFSQITDKKPVKGQKQPRQLTPDDAEDTPKHKWPKKLPKSERRKTYKQYSEVDLRKCLEEVRNNVLTAAEASLKYDIPKKTICAKIKLDPNDAEQSSNREKMFQLLKEIKAILTFTNATPYKSKNIKYYCAYCSTDEPYFEDPDDLRTHTRTEHVGHRTDKIEYAMRPYWMNEVIKLDIKNLQCTVCCVVINNCNEMFRHLKEKHNVVLDQAYTRVIPYILKSDLQCALCNESFSSYLYLDGHMNAHYNNYVCDDCGDTFLAHNRLKQHVKIHNIGKFDCSFCDKVFSLHKYRRKHEALVHEQISKFKCFYCPETFTGGYLRHVHCLQNHAEKVKAITCEFCGETFTWKEYYTRHIRKKHQTKKPYECSKCDKKFYGNYELKEHMLRHVGTKNFECTVCHKKYVSSNSLKHHMKQHKKKQEA